MEHVIKIVIAESERAELDSIKSYLATQRDVQVVGEARDGKECQDMVTRLRPDIALLRIDLPVITGLDVAEHITTKLPDVGVILILTGNEGQDAWRKMLQAGIKDFVTRPLNCERVVEEVRKISEQQAKRRENPAASGLAATIPSGPTRQVITVTGPRGGCGKTIIATNLAVGLAKSSERVALLT
jgi:YesN/AraC family two-component response regulator